MKVLTFLACAGLSVAAWPASAADLLGTAPPLSMPGAQAPTFFEAGSNWYLRGELGVSFDDAPTLSLSSISAPWPSGYATALPLVASDHDSHATDFTGGLGFGYRFNDYLRLDATWDYRTAAGGTRQTTVICPSGLTPMSNPTTLLPAGYLYSVSETCDGVTEFKQYNNTFLANGYVDLGTYSGFTPYVGGGLGFNMNLMSGSVNYYQPNGQYYAANLSQTIPGVPKVWVDPNAQPLAPQPNIPFIQQAWNRPFSATTYTLAWALTAGFGFQINPSTTLDIGYRYLNSGEISKVINPPTGMTIKQTNASQQLLVGIRYVLQ
jgi:opacity protein-like surface antigen